MQTLEFTTYSHLASALINNDFSGLCDEEKKELSKIERFLEREGFSLSHVCNCSEESFFDFPDVGGNLQGDCLTYTAMK
jgi:SOS response regulatory protein OraA/RecX